MKILMAGITGDRVIFGFFFSMMRDSNYTHTVVMKVAVMDLP